MPWSSSRAYSWFQQVLLALKSSRVNDWNRQDKFYRYTAARWVFNEADQIAQRSVRFNMNELARIAAASVGLSTCVKVEKLPEGNFNKAFLMTMQDGLQVVAKVPNPNAGCPHLTTASEVATMSYVWQALHLFYDRELIRGTQARNNLRLPVPKVHAWNSKAASNAVGAEFIIMDKVSGLELRQRWPNMRSDRKLELIETIVQMEKKFTSTPFPAIGSMYFKKDLDDFPYQTLDSEHIGSCSEGAKFVIGPTTARHCYDSGRGEVGFPRGPWTSAQDFLTFLGTREVKCIEQLGVPSHQLGLFGGPRSYKPTTAAKIATLEDYNKIAKYLLPNNASTHPSVLWHGDLNMDNIFVDPDDPTKITALIDWQAIHIAPLFLQATSPQFLDFEGPRHDEMTVPKLPSNFNRLSTLEQKDAKALKLHQTFHKFYEINTASQNRPVYNALRFQETLKSQIIAYAQSLLRGGEPILQGKMMALADKWEQVVGQDGPPCPLQYSEEDRNRQQEDEHLWTQGCMSLCEVLRAVGDTEAGWDGFVTHEQFEPARAKLREVRKAYLEQISEKEEEREEWAKMWPFGTEEELR